jgi:hypothetical protein
MGETPCKKQDLETIPGHLAGIDERVFGAPPCREIVYG